MFRDKRKEFNEAARPFQDWIAIHLTQNEGFEEPPGPAARLALVSRLGEDDGRHFIVLLSAIELEYKRAERRALSGRMLKERSFRAYNDLRTLQQLIKPR
ncbi:hypothetical protein BIY45_01980 [Stenotrophomonas sp. BIIR7]|nr:hypothetical protein BIY45_01980 [Stenotrophomonas sp. BIIR7]